MAYSDEIRTAQQVLNDNSDHKVQNKVLQDAIDQAEAAGVTKSEFVNYAEKLTNYANRDDVEPLSERRARHQGTTFAETDFRREGTGSAAILTSPSDGNVGGLYDDEGNPIDTPGA